MIKILTDSCSDMSPELLKKYDIDYMKMKTVWDGKEIPATLSWDDFSPKKLYDTMREGKRVGTTQVPEQEFTDTFRKYLSEGYDIIYVGCSLKQSGSVNTGAMVAKKILPEFPGRRIECINSIRASMGEGLVAIRAAEIASKEDNFDIAVEKILDERKHINEFVTVNTLDYLKRAGRVKGSSAFFGNLMGIKPIIIADVNGENTPIKKIKGRKKALEECANLLKEAVKDEPKQTIYINHADCSEEEIELMKKIIKDKIPDADIYVNYIGPIIGASIGPDSMGIFGVGAPVTFEYKED